MGELSDRIVEFIDELASEKELPLTTNQYSGQENKLRRENLRSYLKEISKKNNHHVIFVGEAAGYRGCLYSGIPFTSKYQILDEFLRIFECAKFKNDGKYQERSATIVWRTFKKFGFYPLLWNIFPFHPFEEGKKNSSNRTPKPEEVDRYKEYVKVLIKFFDIKKIVAVGRISERILKAIYGEDRVYYVTHPAARNGPKLFKCDVEKLLIEWDISITLN